MKRVMVIIIVAGLVVLTACSPAPLRVEPLPSSTATGAPKTIDPVDKHPQRTPITSPPAGQVDRPNLSITPGAILTRNPLDFCTVGWSAAHRKGLTAAQKRQVLTAYGLSQNQKVAEWDHLVSLQLGGGNGPLNIWPQIDHVQDTRKDALESRLHADVCDRHTMTADEAQNRIRHFWRYW